MASQIVDPRSSPVRLATYTRQDDNTPRLTAITNAVNPPDEALARAVVWLDQNRLPVELDTTTIYALANELLADYALHRVSAVFHNPADTTNSVDPTPVADIHSAITRMNLLKAGLLAHMNNAGGTYHDNQDVTNYTLLAAVDNADDVPTLVTLLRALKAYYNAHRTQATVHPSNDGTNIVTAADPIVGTVTGPLVITDLVATISDVQVFTSSGTWTKPTGFTPQWLDVLLIGSGGGGGSGARRAGGVASSGGAGGAGGGVTRRRIRASLAGATESVVIGAAGVGGNAVAVDDANGGSGTSGLDATFGSLLRAVGGPGGSGGTSAGNSTGGAGGIADGPGGTGADGVSGAAGGAAASSQGAAGGGAGGGIDGGSAAYAGGDGGLNGGTAGTAAAGGNNTGGAGTAGTASIADNPGHGGGGGGANAAGAGGAGGTGGTYGAGGGGGGSSLNGSASGAGGAGAAGLCIVISLP